MQRAAGSVVVLTVLDFSWAALRSARAFSCDFLFLRRVSGTRMFSLVGTELSERDQYVVQHTEVWSGSAGARSEADAAFSLWLTRKLDLIGAQGGSDVRSWQGRGSIVYRALRASDNTSE
jgi:hypothetical protein